MNRRGLRRLFYVAGPTAALLVPCAAVAGGWLDAGASMGGSLAGITLLGGIFIAVVGTIARRVRFEPPSVRVQRVSPLLAAAQSFADIEAALALLVGSFAVITVTGGAASPAYPVLYGVVAFGITFQSRAGAWATVIGAVGFELAATVRGPMDGEALLTTVLHVGLIVAAALAHALFLRGLVARQRSAHRRQLAQEVRRQRDSARDYRLISSALGAESRAGRSRADEELMLATGGVQSIAASVFYNLQLLKRTLDARTVILLWGDERSKSLKIKELVTDSDSVIESGSVKVSGVIGAIVRDRQPFVLASAKSGQVSYIDDGSSVGAFAGVPVVDGQHLRGVLCVDRAEPLGARDTSMMLATCEQLLRAIRAEQVFRSVEKAKYEHERFYHASAMLCRALTMEQVMETAFDAAAQIVTYDVAAISIYHEDRKRHHVHSVRASEGSDKIVDAAKLSGLEFRTNTGLCSMVVKNRHYLPAGGEVRDTTPHLYTKAVPLRRVKSLLVLPLLSADEAIGTITFAAARPGCFGKDVREMLGVISNQVAVSLQNAMMYKRMETMATTDGLTGLTNHRTFQERFGQLLERSARHGHKAAMLLCDVDHFKAVNDTHGHPVGDEVLRRVARVLEGAVRKIDIPARYGGEEFAVVLEATDEAGAVALAERIRTEVSEMMLDSEQGTFQITMSIGVACFPIDGEDRAMLIEHADHALYHCKDTGRNRVTSYQQFLTARNARKAS